MYFRKIIRSGQHHPSLCVGRTLRLLRTDDEDVWPLRCIPLARLYHYPLTVVIDVRGPRSRLAHNWVQMAAQVIRGRPQQKVCFLPQRSLNSVQPLLWNIKTHVCDSSRPERRAHWGVLEKKKKSDLTCITQNSKRCALLSGLLHNFIWRHYQQIMSCFHLM